MRTVWDRILSLHGLVDHEELAWLRDNAHGKCVDVGSLEGKSAFAMALGASKSGGSVTAIDIWNDSIRLNNFTTNLASFDLPVEQLQSDSVKAAQSFPNDSIHFLFLDTSHLHSKTLEELKAWHPKLKNTGTFCGHDFKLEGVQAALKDFGKPYAHAFKGIWRLL